MYQDKPECWDKVTQVYWKNLPELLTPKGPKIQKLPGFDDEFIDIVDYIIRITHKIWEQKNIGYCHDYYGDICPVHTLSSYSDDISTVVNNTLQTLAAFPDRTLIGENVIWRDLGATAGYYSSHRITSIMTNTGPSEFGEVTGKTGRVTTIADCICYENKIIYEWLMRDNSFLLKQLGLDIIDTAHQMANAPASSQFLTWRAAEITRIKAKQPSQQQWPTPVNSELTHLANRWIATCFNDKNYGLINQLYHLNAKIQWPGGVEGIGIPAIRGIFIQCLAQCPNAYVTADHIAVVPFEDKGFDIAIRWCLAGTFIAKDPRLEVYSGQIYFLLAATHLRVIDGKIMNEWTVFDEVAAYANLIRDFNYGSGDITC